MTFTLVRKHFDNCRIKIHSNTDFRMRGDCSTNYVTAHFRVRFDVSYNQYTSVPENVCDLLNQKVTEYCIPFLFGISIQN